MDFTDNICLLPHDGKQLQEKADNLRAASRKGFKALPKKEKNDVHDCRSKEGLFSKWWKRRERVTDFTYLCSIVLAENGILKDFSARTINPHTVFIKVTKVAFE